jgi:cobalt-zinc-cadmium efflux system membrane fusion protein
MIRHILPGRAIALALTLALPLAACGGEPNADEHGEGEEHAEGEEAVKGSHGGRLLTDGDFAVEVTIFEDGQEPQYRVYPMRDGKPVDPKTVNLAITLKRLGGKVDRFAFKPEADYLAGQGVVGEPHSFDVEVIASENSKRHRWAYASPEGRTRITASAAKSGGIRIERVGPQMIGEVRELVGTVQLATTARSEVRARFPGKVMAVTKKVGDRVRAGEVIARVESNESLQVYSVTAPVSGIIAERNTNVGDVAYDSPMFVITDPAQTTVVFNIFPRDLESVRPGQTVLIETLEGNPVASAKLGDYLPEGNVQAGTALMRATLPNPTGQWRAGMALRAKVTVNAVEVPMAVRTEALQRFRDFTVVFANYGEDYEVRMLELGRRTPEWTEVKSGIAPGVPYVTKGAFLVRADVEKSGASHDH